MARPDKVAKVEEIKSKVDEAEAVLFTEYKGLTVEEISDLRRQLRAQGAEYKILKNTLIDLALKDRAIPEMADILQGPTAVAFISSNAPEVAKILKKYSDANNKLTMKAGLLEGSFLNADQVKMVASLPPREVLIAKMLGSLQAPISKLVRTINNPVNKLVYALDGVAKKSA